MPCPPFWYSDTTRETGLFFGRLFKGCFFGDVLSYLPYGILATVIFIVVQGVMRRVRIERDSFFDIVLTLALGLSLTVIFAVTVSPVYGYSLTGAGAAVNLVPFQVLESVKDNPANFYGNILLFIPVGALPIAAVEKIPKAPRDPPLGGGALPCH